jgi:hypothetical protein
MGARHACRGAGGIRHDGAESLPVLKQVCGDQALRSLDLMVAVIPQVDDAAFGALLGEPRADDSAVRWTSPSPTRPATMSPGHERGRAMDITNLGAADGLPPVDWAAVTEKLDAGSVPAPQRCAVFWRRPPGE